MAKLSEKNQTNVGNINWWRFLSRFNWPNSVNWITECCCCCLIELLLLLLFMPMFILVNSDSIYTATSQHKLDSTWTPLPGLFTVNQFLANLWKEMLHRIPLLAKKIAAKTSNLANKQQQQQQQPTLAIC